MYENLKQNAIKFTIPLDLTSFNDKGRDQLFAKLDPDFKKLLKREGEIDLNRVIDGYFEGIFDLMISLRMLVKPAVIEAENYLKITIIILVSN